MMEIIYTYQKLSIKNISLSVKRDTTKGTKRNQSVASNCKSYDEHNCLMPFRNLQKSAHFQS